MKVGCLFIFFLFLTFNCNIFAQNLTTYQIELVDKGSYTKKDIQLSSKSLKRRATQHINLTTRDIPVYKDYIYNISSDKTEILFVSRWANSIFVKTTTDDISRIQNLPFVKKVNLSHHIQSGLTNLPKTKFTPYSNSSHYKTSNYAFADPQISQIEGKILHENGYKGHGITIAVFDAGFYKVNEHPVFKIAFDENRIQAGPDFVRGHNSIVNYTYSSHGQKVLSTMAGNINGTYIGTAPEANYILIRTEDEFTEKLIEEYYWLQAAEYADSIGVDMINSSLGYTIFNDSLENHTYEQMNGDYTLITEAADWAAQTGILVVNSAGNSGNSEWYYIGAPADGDSVFSIGAVNMDGISAEFSSHGPTFDGRVKPNVVGHGAGVYVASGDEDYGPSNGTSFSGPIICGMTASLWQYLKTIEPNISNMDVISLVEESSNLYPDFNADMGYGIPNYMSITPDITPFEISDEDIGLYPNPFTNTLTIHYNFKPSDLIEVYSATGQLLVTKKIQIQCIASSVNTDHLPKGLYFIGINSKHKKNVFKAIK